MAIESDQDRLVFLNPEEFGTVAYYTSVKTGAAKTIHGIFDEEGSDFNPNRWNGTDYQLQDGAHVQSAGPSFTCRSADLENGGRKKDTLVINKQTFRVFEKKPDGTGITRLILNLA
jgi:hypothetical protein